MRNNNGKKIKDSDRVKVNYEKIMNKAEKLGISMSAVSRAIGRSPGFISAMYSGESKMLYCDLKRIARVLNIHGAVKLITDGNTETSVNKDMIADMKADAPVDERMASALETIALALVKALGNENIQEQKR